MSQSFDKKVGSRLQHYEPAPPPYLKSKVLEAVAPNRGLNGWQVTGLVFFIMSFLFWSQGASPGSSDTTAIQPIVEQEVTTVELNELPNARKSEAQTVLAESSNDRLNDEGLGGPVIDENNLQSQKKEDMSKQPEKRESVAKVVAGSTDRSWDGWTVSGRDIVMDQPLVGILSIIQNKEGRSMMLSKAIVPKRKKLPFYVESGLFFLYQQAFPNLEDDFVISDFEGVAGLSPKRLGVFLEGGVYASPIKKLRMHLGVKINTYQQAYRFSIRGFGADSVSVMQSGDAVVFTPLYDQDKIRIDHRLYSAGAKLSLNWRVLPSYTNELVTAVEYLSILNSKHSFRYDERAFDIGYQDQWLVSIGLRKILLENQKGQIQVHPSIRYSLNRSNPQKNQALSMKPYSVGISFSYIFGNFRSR